MAFVLSHWRRSLTFLSGTHRTSSISAKGRFCAIFDSRPLTRPPQSAIMMLLVGRPPEAPYISRAGQLLYANHGAGNYQQGGRQSAEHILLSFQECDEQREHLAIRLGVFFMPKKKPPLGHLPWITDRCAGGIIAFILR